MNKDEIEGKARNIKGAIKEGVGRATGNPRLEDEGADERDSGAVQEKAGQVRRNVGDAVEDLGKKIKR
jgi:uncharacterized protein YjbJ (UPF0337 family)